MQSLGEELRDHCDALVQRWYDRWRESHPAQEVAEAALKDSLEPQLRLIGEQLRDLRAAEHPDQIWKVTERLQPEARVSQDIPIEEVVQEYALVTDVVRRWIAERGIEVTFPEYAYFYSAMYELTAESVRRYAAYQAEEVRRQRAQYLASVMHQLRTPLSALSLQLERLERKDRPPDAETVSKLRRNVRRIRRLVDGILRLERFQTWEVPVHPEETRPAQLVDAIISDHELEAARKGLRFEAHVNRSLRMTIDPELFVDALGNLVQNAIKYTTEGFVIVDAAEHDDGVVFRVRDSGPGISAERRRQLFKSAQPGSLGGAGLGLLIAQHAAQAQGGQVDVHSEPGRGSTFSLRLPWVVPARHAGEPIGERGGDVQRPTGPPVAAGASPT
jgi:signal transduction histidine kinase